MAHFKAIAAIVLILLGMVIILQNTEPVTTKLLFYTITMPRAALLFGATCIGFTLGILFSYFIKKDSGKDKSPDLPNNV